MLCKKILEAMSFGSSRFYYYCSIDQIKHEVCFLAIELEAKVTGDCLTVSDTAASFLKIES